MSTAAAESFWHRPRGQNVCQIGIRSGCRVASQHVEVAIFFADRRTKVAAKKLEKVIQAGRPEKLGQFRSDVDKLTKIDRFMTKATKIDDNLTN